MPETIAPELQMEMLRRRAQQPASSAGVGAEAANSLNPENPIAREGMTKPTQISGGAAGTPTGMAQNQVKQEKGEARLLMETMIWRIKKLTERGE